MGGSGPGWFVYAVKFGAFGSHRMKLRDPESWMANHLDRVRRLGAHLGPNLVQLSPRWKRNVERLDEFLSIAPRSIRWAVELREPSWLHDDVFDVLRRHNAALRIHDLAESHPFNSPPTGRMCDSTGPTPSSIRTTVRTARLACAAGRIGWGHCSNRAATCTAYFNNDWYGHAVTDAVVLRDQMARPSLQPEPSG